MTHRGDTFEPQPETRRLYDGLYRDVYLRLYERLRPLYEKIGRITHPQG